ncbi:MAG: hypothetical protein JJ846_007855 [Prochlorococcus marinus CUG1437]|nr:hypothetical protein [Prochlorococcus marinus CUG1437]
MIFVDPGTSIQTGISALKILLAVDVKVRHAELFGAYFYSIFFLIPKNDFYFFLISFLIS